MHNDIERVIRVLNDANVKYLIVGGVAVVLHGHLRTTADLDLVIGLEEENAAAAMRALGSLGYQPRAPVPIQAFADSEQRRSWVEDKGLTVFSLWSNQIPTLEVDVFVESPFEFEEALKRSQEVELDTLHARVVGVDDLIDMKRAVGRAVDDSDVAALEAVRAEMQDGEQ